MKKEKFCKCGHLLDPDHKKNNKFIGIKYKSLIPCSKCKCCHYTRREYPTKFDSILVYTIIGLMLFIIGSAIFFAYDSYVTYQKLLIKDTNGILHKNIPLTYGDIFVLIPPFIILICMYLFMNLILDPIIIHRRMKNTPINPKEDDPNKS